MWNTLCRVSRKFLTFAIVIFGKREPTVFRSILEELPRTSANKRRLHAHPLSAWALVVFGDGPAGSSSPKMDCLIMKVPHASFFEKYRKQHTSMKPSSNEKEDRPPPVWSFRHLAEKLLEGHECFRQAAERLRERKWCFRHMAGILRGEKWRFRHVAGIVREEKQCFRQMAGMLRKEKQRFRQVAGVFKLFY